MICDITKTDIQALNDTDLRDLIGLLCIAELQAAGQSAAGVTYGGNQDAADGGVDVRVKASGGWRDNGYIPHRNTVFQVKKPSMGTASISEEMMPKGTLRGSIAQLVAEGGAYIIVSSKDDCTDSMLTERIRSMRSCLDTVDVSGRVSVDFYDCKRIACWANVYPSVAVWIYQHIGKTVLQGWYPYSNWSSNHRTSYFFDDNVQISKYPVQDKKLTVIQGIDQIRSVLCEPGSSIRLTGLSGVGKTRLLEALFDDSIGTNVLPQSLALYTDMGHEPRPLPTHLAESLVAYSKRSILLIDNCAPEMHRTLTEICLRPGSNLSLITVEYDVRGDVPQETNVYVMEPGSEDVMKQLVKARFPDMHPYDVDVVTGFSGGNARIAIALAQTCEPGETIRELSDQQLLNRLIFQRSQPNEQLLQSVKALSLVYSYNGEYGDDSGELAVLAQIAGVQSIDLYRYCAELEQCGLIQSRTPYKAVLPHALSNRLANDALSTWPANYLLGIFLASGNDRMLRSFAHRIGYLHQNPAAICIAKALLEVSQYAGAVAHDN